MSWLASIWMSIKAFFGVASRIVASNPTLAKASLAAGLGLFLERNEHYADGIVKAVQGLREAIQEGRISSNDVLHEEFNNLLNGYGIRGATLAALDALIIGAIETIEDVVGLDGPVTQVAVWDDILAEAERVARAYMT